MATPNLIWAIYNHEPKSAGWLFLDSEPEALNIATPKGFTLDGAAKKCYDAASRRMIKGCSLVLHRRRSGHSISLLCCQGWRNYSLH